MARKKPGDPSALRALINAIRWFDETVPEPIQNALALAAVFMIIGYSVSYGSAFMTPSDDYVEIESVSVSDAPYNATVHEVNVTWTAAESYPARVVSKLYYVSPNGTTSEVAVWRFNALLEEGTHQANVTFDLPKSAREGQYYYSLHATFNVDHNVRKDFTIETSTFYYGNQTNKTNTTTMTSRAHSEELLITNEDFEPAPLLIAWQSGQGLPSYSRDGAARPRDSYPSEGNYSRETWNSTGPYSGGENDAALTRSERSDSSRT